MGIQYAPYIEQRVLAFSNIIFVNFQNNPLVTKTQVSGMWLKIETSNESIYSVNSGSNFDYDEGWAKFDISDLIEDNAIPDNDYCKIQIAYKGEETEIDNQVAFSDVSYAKKIKVPVVIDAEFSDDFIKLEISTEYSEPIISYQIKFHTNGIANNETLVYDTGLIQHNTSLDAISDNGQERTATLKYTINYIFPNVNLIDFVATTINGAIIEAGTELESSDIVTIDEISSDLQIKLLNNNGGYDLSENTSVIYKEETEARWVKIPEDKIDWNIQQGEPIRYGVLISQTEQDGNTSKKITPTNYITPDFEDIFLSDGKKQLRIAYNPKVSSIKNTILESKTDTIGGQFPFFFRNGNVKYKEIPISGLISYHMDPDELFMSKNDLGLAATASQRADTQSTNSTSLRPLPSTNLTGANIAAERKFKMEVLEWLNNGRPKLFRSPTEGNFIVRLMNVSLSPNDTLGRMLHIFSATGYEMAEYNYDNLIKYDLIYSKKEG